MIALLIDNDNDVQVISSYDQFNFLNTNNCEQNLNFSLTYLTKPNNSSKNYSIRFDLFKKDPQIYVSSRHFKIRFPFLRVYRMAVVLTVPMDSVSGSSDCPLQCHNGECIQYMNEETFVADVTVVGLVVDVIFLLIVAIVRLAQFVSECFKIDLYVSVL
ncbi:unnamed protein product [Rotaria socialis]|nr:unnamed protein product [Rotaria socialis]CAF4527838.1 unnamed protein product [Rotaria socialis]